MEETNVEAPTFARIFKEMIIVADQDRPLVRAPKGTVIRKLSLDLYVNEINAVCGLLHAYHWPFCADAVYRYNLVNDSTLSHGIALPSEWVLEEVQPWLRAHATFINGGNAPTLEGNLFEQGFDR